VTKLHVKKREEKAKRATAKLEARKKDWAAKGKQGEFAGLNRKERRKLEMEARAKAAGSS
jgi:hypothetical protein